MHVAQGPAGDLGLNPQLHLHTGSIGESVSTHIRNIEGSPRYMAIVQPEAIVGL